MLFEEVVGAFVARLGVVCVDSVPSLQLERFGGGQEGHVSNPLLGIGRHACEQRLEVFAHATDGFGVEAGRAVFEGERQWLARYGHQNEGIVCLLE